MALSPSHKRASLSPCSRRWIALAVAITLPIKYICIANKAVKPLMIIASMVIKEVVLKAARGARLARSEREGGWPSYIGAGRLMAPRAEGAKKGHRPA
jgi:hypothetical protein